MLVEDPIEAFRNRYQLKYRDIPLLYLLNNYGTLQLKDIARTFQQMPQEIRPECKRLSTPKIDVPAIIKAEGKIKKDTRLSLTQEGEVIVKKLIRLLNSSHLTIE